MRQASDRQNVCRLIESSEIQELRRNLASYRNHALIGAPKPVAFSFDLVLLDEGTVDNGVNVLKNLKILDLIVKASGPKPNRFFVSELFTHGAAQVRKHVDILGFQGIAPQKRQTVNVVLFERLQDALLHAFVVGLARVKVPAFGIEAPTAAKPAARNEKTNACFQSTNPSLRIAI